MWGCKAFVTFQAEQRSSVIEMMGWGGLQLWARSSAAKHKFVLGVRLAARWLHSEPTAQQQGGVAVHLAIGPAYTIWGANTGVGKTLGSMGLARAARALQARQ